MCAVFYSKPDQAHMFFLTYANVHLYHIVFSPFYGMTLLTKVGLLAHIPSILSHALPQEALRLGVAGTLHLPADF